MIHLWGDLPWFLIFYHLSESERLQDATNEQDAPADPANKQCWAKCVTGKKKRRSRKQKTLHCTHTIGIIWWNNYMQAKQHHTWLFLLRPFPCSSPLPSFLVCSWCRWTSWNFPQFDWHTQKLLQCHTHLREGEKQELSDLFTSAALSAWSNTAIMTAVDAHIKYEVF